MTKPDLVPDLMLLLALRELGGGSVYLARELIQAKTDGAWRLPSSTAYTAAMPRLRTARAVEPYGLGADYRVTASGDEDIDRRVRLVRLLLPPAK